MLESHIYSFNVHAIRSCVFCCFYEHEIRIRLYFISKTSWIWAMWPIFQLCFYNRIKVQHPQPSSSIKHLKKRNTDTHLHSQMEREKKRECKRGPNWMHNSTLSLQCSCNKNNNTAANMLSKRRMTSAIYGAIDCECTPLLFSYECTLWSGTQTDVNVFSLRLNIKIREEWTTAAATATIAIATTTTTTIAETVCITKRVQVKHFVCAIEDMENSL